MSKTIDAMKKLLAAISATDFTCRLGDEVDAVEKAIATAEAQSAEPVGTVRAKSDSYGGTFVHWTQMPVAGMKLYTHPKPPATLSAEPVIDKDALGRSTKFIQPAPPVQKLPPNCGTGYCSCIECFKTPVGGERDALMAVFP